MAFYRLPYSCRNIPCISLSGWSRPWPSRCQPALFVTALALACTRCSSTRISCGDNCPAWQPGRQISQNAEDYDEIEYSDKNWRIGPYLQNGTTDYGWALKKDGLATRSFALEHIRPWRMELWDGPIHPPSPDDPSWTNTLAICAVMRDEEPDNVEEFVKYHRWIGTDKIFLAENADEVPNSVRDRMQPLVDEGVVEIMAIGTGAKKPIQNRWYNRCAKPDMAGLYAWVAFTDLDEYIVMLDKQLAAQNPDLKALLREWRHVAGIALQWVLFGSSGHVARPQGGQVAHYTKCRAPAIPHITKCVANMFYASPHTVPGFSVHHCQYRVLSDDLQANAVVLGNGDTMPMVDSTSNGNLGREAWIGPTRSYQGRMKSTFAKEHASLTDAYKIVLFHYVTRSLEEFAHRKITMHTGQWGTRFRSRVKKNAGEDDDEQPQMRPEMMAYFDKKEGLDGTSETCSSAAKHEYASRCCGGPTYDQAQALLQPS